MSGPLTRDRVGLGWRPELAAGILGHLDRIDLVEVIAEDLFGISGARLRAMRTLAREVPVTVHGVSLGLASMARVDERRLGLVAHVVERLQPESWSEHLAFVRGGGVEIGHLAAPPRTQATVDGTWLNMERARAVVGEAPAVENVATLIDPPGSDLTETQWLVRTLKATGAPLLLDLHNLYANATNFGFNALELLGEVAPAVRAVHVAGGRRVSSVDGSQRILDDHLHPVPHAVFQLLEELAACAPQPLTVLLERDGKYPEMGELLVELDGMRAALARGRARGVCGEVHP